MLLQAIGAVLPAALAVALGPPPVIGVVLILAGARGRLNGPLFAVGWLVGLSVMTGVVTVVFRGADDADSTSSAIADWGRVLVGAALVVLGLRTWWSRPRRGDAIAVPTWMTRLEQATPTSALGLGALLSGANPKNFVLAAAAATSVAESGVEGVKLVVATLVFVLVGSLTVVGAVLVGLLGGRRGASMLEDVREFMVANSVVITVVVMMILGAKILGDGLIGLSR